MNLIFMRQDLILMRQGDTSLAPPVTKTGGAQISDLLRAPYVQHNHLLINYHKLLKLYQDDEDSYLTSSFY
jgi:hypothetical protein